MLWPIRVVILGGRFWVKQAALLDGFAFDPFPFQRDDLAAPEVDVGRCEIAESLVVATVVVMIDEGRNLPLEIPGRK